jgi:hypothetical protein
VGIVETERAHGSIEAGTRPVVIGPFGRFVHKSMTVVDPASSSRVAGITTRVGRADREPRVGRRIGEVRRNATASAGPEVSR